jgi:transposase
MGGDWSSASPVKHAAIVPTFNATEPLPALHSLITGLRRDLDAVTAGLTLPWSSGPVEGNVNRIKTIKRQMYGRASFDLLRKRILLAA